MTLNIIKLMYAVYKNASYRYYPAISSNKKRKILLFHQHPNQKQISWHRFYHRKGQNFTISKLHDRVAKLSLFIKETDENNNSKTRKLYFINVYAPWKAEDSDTEIIYSILHNELKQNSKHTFICGDFNAIIASNHQKYPTNIGHFGKGILNNNGNHLTDLLVQNNFYATNTFFQP